MPAPQALKMQNQHDDGAEPAATGASSPLLGGKAEGQGPNVRELRCLRRRPLPHEVEALIADYAATTATMRPYLCGLRRAGDVRGATSGDHEPCRPIVTRSRLRLARDRTPGACTTPIDRRTPCRPITKTPSTMVV